MSRNTTGGLIFEKENPIVRPDSIDISKTQFAKFIEEKGGKIEGKKLQPDAAFYFSDTNEIVVYEKKLQTTNGSCDEKIAAGPFLLEQYRDIAKTIGIKKSNVNLIYVLSPWFAQNKYKKLLNYIKKHGCNYYFSEGDDKNKTLMLNYRSEI